MHINWPIGPITPCVILPIMHKHWGSLGGVIQVIISTLEETPEEKKGSMSLILFLMCHGFHNMYYENYVKTKAPFIKFCLTAT